MQRRRITSTLLNSSTHLCCTCSCCHCSSSLFLSILFTHSRSLSHLCSLKSCLFYRHPWCCSTCSFVNKGGCQLLLFFNNGGCQWSMVGAVHFLHMQWQQPNNHPLCNSCGATVLLLLQYKLAFCIFSTLTILRASVAKFTGTSQTFQSPESPKHTFSHKKGSLQPDGMPHHI